MALASLVSFQKQNQDQKINNAFAMLMLFKKQKLQSSHPFGMLCNSRLKSQGSL